MDGLPKIGMDNALAPVSARSRLAEVYSRRPYEEPSRPLENADQRPEEPVEEGKGLYVDVYA